MSFAIELPDYQERIDQFRQEHPSAVALPQVERPSAQQFIEKLQDRVPPETGNGRFTISPSQSDPGSVPATLIRNLQENPVDPVAVPEGSSIVPFRPDAGRDLPAIIESRRQAAEVLMADARETAQDRRNLASMRLFVTRYKLQNEGQLPQMNLIMPNGSTFSDVPVVSSLSDVQGPVIGQYVINSGRLYEYGKVYNSDTDGYEMGWREVDTVRFMSRPPQGATVEGQTRDVTVTGPDGRVALYDDVRIVESTPLDAVTGDIVLFPVAAYKCCLADNRIYEAYRYEADGTWTNLSTNQTGVSELGSDFIGDDLPKRINTLDVAATVTLADGEQLNNVPIVHELAANADEGDYAVVNVSSRPAVFTLFRYTDGEWQELTMAVESNGNIVATI